MTNKLEQAARQALELMDAGSYIPAMRVLREALAEPQCWCETCRPITLTDMRMVLCPDCGNKRCPHATDHRNACTGSNKPGQKGSSYEHCKPAEQEPVAWYSVKGGFNTCGEGKPLYAAPVRTKDLTDDEIMKINVDTASIVPTCDRQFHFARAVIQEFRRKNGIV